MGAFLLLWLTRLLVGLFFLGLVGSAVVVIITFVEDGQLLLESDEQSKMASDSDKERLVPSTAREAF